MARTARRGRLAALIVALVLVSAFLHAGWNALLRVEPDKDRGLVAAIAFASLFACIVAGVRWALGSSPFASLAALGWTLLAGAFEAGVAGRRRTRGLAALDPVVW